MRPVPGTGVDGRFQSTRLREARPGCRFRPVRWTTFQSTRLREARRRKHGVNALQTGVSIHAPA